MTSPNEASRMAPLDPPVTRPNSSAIALLGFSGWISEIPRRELLFQYRCRVTRTLRCRHLHRNLPYRVVIRSNDLKLRWAYVFDVRRIPIE